MDGLSRHKTKTRHYDVIVITEGSLNDNILDTELLNLHFGMYRKKDRLVESGLIKEGGMLIGVSKK